MCRHDPSSPNGDGGTVGGDPIVGPRQDPGERAERCVAWRPTVVSMGSQFLGLLWGRVEFVEGQLAEKNEEHGILLDRITKVIDLQSACCLRSVQGKPRFPCGPS